MPNGGQGGVVVTHSPPTSEVCGSNPRKLVVATDVRQFTVENLGQL